MSDCITAWQQCLEKIEQSENISVSNYKTWFVPVKPLKLENQTLTLEVPSHYFVETLEGPAYFDILCNAVRSVIGPNAKLMYKIHIAQNNVEESGKRNTPQLDGGFTGVEQNENMVNPFEIVGRRVLKIDPQLNSDYTFDNYVIGNNNKLACSVASAVAQKPGDNAFNPLFLFGNSGVGKTHLIQAIGAAVKSQDPNKNVVYLAASSFMRQLQDAQMNKMVPGFINFYQMIDVLIIDDIQEIAGKTGTENIFFQVFNHLQQNKKQIVIAADKRPSEIEGMEDRLLTRFKSGVVVEVFMPDYNTRVKIIKNRIEKDGITISDDVIDYVANNVQTSVRELEGSLYSMLAFSTLTHEDVTIDIARQVIGNLIKTEVRDINIDTIIKAVCESYSVDEVLLQRDTRKREIVMARQVAMYLCKEMTQASLSSIGLRLGNRNHSTVLYSIKAVKDMIETDKDFEQQIRNIQNNIKG